MTDDMLPSYVELPVTPGAPPGSSWGLWGTDDRLGALNLLTPARRTAAAAEVTRGLVFGLNWQMDQPEPPLFKREAFVHEVHELPRGPYYVDTMNNWNTQSSTQWDGFLHVAYTENGKEGAQFYNGLPAAEHGLNHWAAEGICGRSYLLDVERHLTAHDRRLDYTVAEPIGASELQAALSAQRQPLHAGDVLLIRTGWTTWYRGLDHQHRLETSERSSSPGLAAGREMLELLWDLHISAVALDNPSAEAWPPRAFRHAPGIRHNHRDPAEFLHPHLLSLLGIPIGEMFDLDALADDSARTGVYSGLLMSAPLNLPGGVGSPANALVMR